MKKKVIYALILFAILFVPSSCVLLSSQEKSTVPVDQNECDNQTIQGIAIPNPSWTWFDMEIGRSTSADLISRHGEPYSKQAFKFKTTEGCIYQYLVKNTGSVQYLSKDVGSAQNLFDYAGSSVFFTVAGGRIREIEITSPGFVLHDDQKPVYLKELVDLYGRPQLIGFNKTLGSHARLIVWSNQGIRASVWIGYESSINGTLSIDINKAGPSYIVYFAPMPSEDYIGSFYSSGFSETRPDSDEVDVYPQDPFKWDDEPFFQ
jgi:hypothetical protein